MGKPETGMDEATIPRLPIIGITMGDPAGVGPEIVAKAFLHEDLYRIAKPLAVGDASVLALVIARLGIPVEIHPIDEPGRADFRFGTIDVLDMGSIDAERLEVGMVSKAAGNAAFQAVYAAIRHAIDGKIDATVTSPIHKGALNAAGHEFAGHTEIFAHYTQTARYSMMLAEGNLRVVHVSTHVSLKHACELVKKERILTTIRLAHTAMRDFGIEHPLVGVAALNPHASDGGLFGSEERDEIAPAIRQARDLGIDVEGPIPADTLYSKAAGGKYDIVVAMYHDQGHIPVKMAGFIWDQARGAWKSVRGVNITLGLPIIRTSVDHGTAFDQAWKGTASEESLVEAIEYAARFAQRRMGS